MNIYDLLEEAAEKLASDLHICVGLPPVLRINGKLTKLDYENITVEMVKSFAELLLKPSQLSCLVDHGEVDLSIKTNTEKRFRLNVYKERGFFSFAFRYLNSNILSFSKLGLPKNVNDLCDLKQGLVLITGPTGMGKTTTLTAMVDWINENKDVHIVTLEEPVEFIHEHKKSIVSQREIGYDSESFVTSLKAVLRQDPDVILVGEMRDLDSISIALTAAETGHLVLSTLHTIGADKTISRIVDVFPAHQQSQVKAQLSIVLSAVISQQLLPSADGKKLVLAYEVMICNPAIRALIREGKTHQIKNVIQTNLTKGMITMDKCIYSLFKRGEITADTAMTYCVNKESMAKYLSF